MLVAMTPSPTLTLPTAGGYEWVPSDWFGLLQFIAAVIGLAFAGWQLRRTAVATEATNAALTRRLLHNDLLVLLPEVQRLEDDFDAAMKSGDPDAVAGSLATYHRRVSVIVGTLKSDDALSTEKAVSLLSQAARLASTAKGDLNSSTSKPIDDIVQQVRKKMVSAGTEVIELTARLAKAATVKDER